jgi:hypothetical protein
MTLLENKEVLANCSLQLPGAYLKTPISKKFLKPQ